MNKKAFFTTQPGLFFLAGLLIGAALMYYVMSKGLLPF